MSTTIREQLRTLSFVEGLTDTALHQLSHLLQPADYACDELLYSRGDERKIMAIVVSGAVLIEKSLHGRPIRVATLGPGEAVGEGLLLDDRMHGTTARALTDTSVLLLSKEHVTQMIRETPALYAALVGRAARAIAHRLSAVDATMFGRGRALGFGGKQTRIERDLLGEREVPDEALYGIQTLRALENFPITGVPLREFPSLIDALAAVKEAAALANAERGLLPEALSELIARAAREIRSGRHHEHFLVDMIQGGAGTSTNMNANEVIANRALELLGRPRGDYQSVHPNNHVNLSQSTNDVYPTAMKLALHSQIEGLARAMSELAAAFLAKGEEFSPFIKMGRTQLQDAVPMTLGQEFTAFGRTILEDVQRLGEAQALIREINLGGTAIGTGITAPHGYAEAVRAHLSRITGLELITAPDLIEATADTGAFVQLSGVLKRCAVKLSKICNDLRLLASGPRAGFNEIDLPAMQPGSSIMPGKVNPVIPEVVNQVCFDIIGGDITVTMAAEAGQLQLNVFEPVIAFRLLAGISSLTNACVVLRERCIDGITANPERMRWFVEHSVGIITALVPIIGYERSTEIAREALETGRGVYELVMEHKLLTREELDRALNPEAMTGSYCGASRGRSALAMPARRRKRIDPALFALPVEQIRAGTYSDAYFNSARAALRAEGREARVTWQLSVKRDGWLGGIDEAVALLKLCSDDFTALEVHALYEGDRVDAWDTVMTVEGDYALFAHLETPILGTLARRTRLCTNLRTLVDGARPKPVFYLGARSEHPLLQPGDGLSAHVAGAASVSTDALGMLTGKSGVGTVAHALIAAHGGDTVAATRAVAAVTPKDVQLIVPVDYENDSVGTSLAVARALDDRLWGVRLDTSEFMVDRSVIGQMGIFRPTGVNPRLVWNVRDALDAEGFGDVRIVVSGGFDLDRIREFEDEDVPVDAYGVGATAHEGRWDFTGDVVQLDGKPQGKAGRELRPNPRLERVK